MIALTSVRYLEYGMRYLLLLNKDTGSPLRCLGADTALRKTNELDKKNEGTQITDHSVTLLETSVCCGC